VMHR